MSYKFSFILSMIFVALFTIFAIDILNIQTIYGYLDSASVSISYQISQSGDLSSSFQKEINEKYDLEFNCVQNCNPKFGDTVTYVLTKNINTYLVKQGIYKVSIKRFAVVGYFS